MGTQKGVEIFAEEGKKKPFWKKEPMDEKNPEKQPWYTTPVGKIATGAAILTISTVGLFAPPVTGYAVVGLVAGGALVFKGITEITQKNIINPLDEVENELKK